MAPVKFRMGIQHIIDQLGLGPVAFFHGRQAALIQQPLGHEIYQVDAEYRRSIVGRIMIRKGFIVHHSRQLRVPAFQEIFLGHDHGYPGRTDVLLGPIVYQGKFINRDGPAQDIRRHIHDQRHFSRIGIIKILQSFSGTVPCQVQIGTVFRQLQLFRAGNPVQTRSFATVDFHGFPYLVGLFDGLFREGAGNGISRHFIWGQEVHGDHRELQRSSASHEHHHPAVIHPQQLLDVSLGLVVHFFEQGIPMADFQHGHPTAFIIQQFPLRLFQDRQRHHGRTCSKIINSSHLVHLQSYVLSARPAVSARTRWI